MCCTDAYATATKGLKSARTLGGLNPENIEDVNDALNEEVRCNVILFVMLCVVMMRCVVCCSIA